MGTFTGTSGADTISPVLVSGGITSDIDFPTASGEDPDVISGLGGDDVLDGGGGPDTVFGGRGNDTIFAGEGAERLDGGAGIDGLDVTATSLAYFIDLTTGATSFTGESFTHFENIFAGTGNDSLTGTIGANALFGGGGDDTLEGLAGRDRLDGGTGLDVIRASLDVNQAFGGDGSDTFDFGHFTTGLQISLITGLTNRTGEVVEGFENIIAGAGDDTLQGTAGDNFIVAGGGNDLIQHSGGGDTVTGGLGDDTIFASAEFNVLNGGDGIDTANTTAFDGDYNINLVTGETTFAGESIADFENLITGDGNDRLTGTEGSNLLAGGAGNDTLIGAAGQDTLLGGAGDDLIIGSTGVNTAQGNLGIDTLDMSVFGVVLELDMTTGLTNFPGESFLGFENVLSGAGDDLLVGNVASNRIEGGEGNDTIKGGAGLRADTLIGGGGDDTLFLGKATDLLFGGAGSNALDASAVLGGVVVDMATGQVNGLKALFGRFTSLTTTSQDDTILLDTDIALRGGAGRDTVVITGALAASGVTVTLGVGMAGSDKAWRGIDAIVTGAGTDAITGTAGNNLIQTKRGDDALLGGDGNDSLQGGAGQDSLTGGTGADHFIFDDGDSGPLDSDVILGGAAAFDRAGQRGGDVIDLSLMDANRAVDGDQAFVFGGTGRGHVRVVADNGRTIVQGNTDGDAAFEFVLIINDGTLQTSAYTAADFLL